MSYFVSTTIMHKRTMVQHHRDMKEITLLQWESEFPSRFENILMEGGKKWFNKSNSAGCVQGMLTTGQASNQILRLRTQGKAEESLKITQHSKSVLSQLMWEMASESRQSGQLGRVKEMHAFICVHGCISWTFCSNAERFYVWKINL